MENSSAMSNGRAAPPSSPLQKEPRGLILRSANSSNLIPEFDILKIST